MKKIGLLLATIAASASLHAQDAAPSYSVTVDFPYASKYVFRGVELAKESLQPSIEVAVGNFYGGVWTNQPVTSNIDNEFDFYAGYGIPLNDTWKLDVGGTFYYYPELDSSTGLDEHTFEGYVGATGNVAGFTPGVYAYYDFDLKNTTLQAQVGYSVPLEAVGASLDLAATYGWVNADVGEDYNYWSIGATVPYKLTEKATVSGGVSYANNDLGAVEGDHLWFTVGLTVGF